MEHTTYLFIDGAYFRRIHAQEMQKVFGISGDLALNRAADTVGALKTYFYDCEDLPRQNESQADFDARAQIQRGQLDKIRALRGFHLQTGTMKSGKRREQKEVDVLLAVDMLTHGFSRNMTRAVLITGDLDFRPVVEALVRGGIFVEVWYEKSSASAELPFAADFGNELTWHQLYNWNSDEFRQKYTPPVVQVNGSLPPTSVTIAKGEWDRYPIELCETYGGRGYSLIAYFGNNGVQYFNHVERAVVEGYFVVLHGPITWTYDARARS